MKIKKEYKYGPVIFLTEKNVKKIEEQCEVVNEKEIDMIEEQCQVCDKLFVGKNIARLLKETETGMMCKNHTLEEIKTSEDYAKNGYPCDDCSLSPAYCGHECCQRNRA